MKRKRILSAALAFVLAAGTLSANVYAKGYDVSANNRSSYTATGVGTGAFPNLGEGVSMTVDMAAQRAIERSSAIKSYQDNIEIAKDSMDDIEVYRRWVSEWNDVTSYAISYKQLEAQVEQLNDRIEIEKASLRYRIETYFINIIEAQNDLAIYDENLDIAERNLEVSKKQYELGSISKSAYDNAVQTYNNVVLGKTTLENTIEANYTSLNTLLDYNVAATYPIELGEEITYTPIDPTSLDAHVALATSSSNINIKILEDNVEIAKYTLSLHSDIYSAETKLQKEAEVYTATSTLSNTKLSVEGAVKTLYDSIKLAEDNYNNLQEQLTNLNNNISIYEKQLQLGQITKLQMDNYYYQQKDLANSIKEAEYSHYLLVKRYEDPNLLSAQ